MTPRATSFVDYSKPIPVYADDHFSAAQIADRLGVDALEVVVVAHQLKISTFLYTAEQAFAITKKLQGIA